MAKFRVRLKVQALELEIDGEREDIPAISSAIQQQFAGLIRPAESMANGAKMLDAPSTSVVDSPSPKRKSKSSRRNNASGDVVAADPLDLQHNSSIYGNPVQGWQTIEKCIWLMYVLQKTTLAPTVSGPQLAATYNTHFKAAGKLHPPVVTRELGKAKVQNPALVSEDKKHEPSHWHLTDQGIKNAQQLIDSVLNPA